MIESFKTGVTSATPQKLQLNAGVFVTKYEKGSAIAESDIIGATRGGGSISIVPTVHQVSADGVPTNYKGLDRIDEWVATMDTTLLEFKPETVKLALGGGFETTEKSGDLVITCKNTINEEMDYNDIYWIGDLSDGNPVIVHFKNAMNKSGFTLTISDKGEGTFPVSLVANYSYDDIKTGVAPFEIIFVNKAED